MVIGAIAPPNFQTDKQLIECAKELGFFCSFLSVKGHTDYREDLFKDALNDWGFYGPDQMRPEWVRTK